MKLLIFTLVLFVGLSGYAEEDSEKKVDDVKEDEALESEMASAINDVQDSWGVYGSFAYLDSWLPGKIGMSISYGDDDRFYELAIQQASYSFDFLIDDLGGVTDRRIHFTIRSHPWENSTNFQYGLFYNTLNISLGNSYTAVATEEFDDIEINTLGVMWGVGNRWNWDSGLSMGFDWLKVFMPLMSLNKDTGFLDNATSGDSKDEVKRLVDVVGKIPTFTLAHFEIGYRF